MERSGLMCVGRLGLIGSRPWPPHDTRIELTDAAIVAGFPAPPHLSFRHPGATPVSRAGPLSPPVRSWHMASRSLQGPPVDWTRFGRRLSTIWPRSTGNRSVPERGIGRLIVIGCLHVIKVIYLEGEAQTPL